MRILALDLATATGWAVWHDGLKQPLSGSAIFTGSLGEFATRFEDWLALAIKANGVTHVVVEAPIPMIRSTTISTMLRLYGAHVILRKICFARGLPLACVNVATWRTMFIGVSRAPKAIRRHKRSAWLKARTIEECQRRGWNPTTNDEADALGVLAYAQAWLAACEQAETSEFFLAA